MCVARSRVWLSESVLVQLGDYSHVIWLNCSPQWPTEKELLFEKIRAAFRVQIQADHRLTWQKNSGVGLFADFQDDVIEDRRIHSV